MRAFLLILSLLTCLAAHDSSLAAERPNIVVILADDFGVGDIQAHYPNNKIATPHLDRLVREGMSFTDAHSPSAVCTPTRYGLLTGRYAWRTRLQEWVLAAYEPPLIPATRPTIASFLQSHGYHTAAIGKWHLGWDWPGPQPSRMTEQRNGQKFLTWDFSQPIQSGPTERGFNYYFGVDLPNMPPFTYLENRHVVDQPVERLRVDPQEGIVLPKAFDGCPAAPQWRLQKILPEITQRAVAHIQQRSAQQQPFFLFFSLTSPHEPVVPSANFRGRSGIAPIADFVMETDWAVGQVMQAIDESGIGKHTIVIFTADNGHSHYTGWEALVQAGHLPSGPYRGHKGDIWEGGHRVPLIVRWPHKVTAGDRCDQLVSLTDLFATCAEIVGGQLPELGAEDSLSCLPAVLGTGRGPRTSLVSHSNMGEFAYREGPWKLVFKMADKNLQRSRGRPTVVELYRLDSDPAESRDLAEAHPQIVERMTDALQAVVDQGASRPGLRATNDTQVDFRSTQNQRWAPPTAEAQSLD